MVGNSHGLYYATHGETKWQLTKTLFENWIDGYKFYGSYVNERTINYVSKYMTKKDEDNPDYISIVLCSKGLGANYAKENQLKHRWNKKKTIITYKARNGQDLPLPRYYKTQLYTEDQRQLLWLYAEDKGTKWVKGFEVIEANTEKGHTNTRRIHIHGLYYATHGETKWQLTKTLYENWIDGYRFYGSYVNERTINYVSKYMTKKDEDNPDYIGIVLCSKGLGANYAKRMAYKHEWNKEKNYRDWETDRKSTRLNSSHITRSRMPSSA